MEEFPENSTGKFLGSVAGQTAELLGKGNVAVYNDVYWQFLAYDKEGIEQMRWLKDKGELHPAYLSAWELIASGDPAKIWEGNRLLFFNEQKFILQRVTFDPIREIYLPGDVGQRMAKETGPLFPGATPFKQVGDDLTDVRQRWDDWISKRLWPQWKSFSTDPKNQGLLKRKMEFLGNPNR